MFILTTQPVDKTLLSDILSGAEYIIQFSVYTQLYNVRNKKFWFHNFSAEKSSELENSCPYPT